MAKKDTSEPVVTGSTEAPNQYVRIVNLTKAQRQYPLTDGRWISLGPWVPRQTIHISEPIKREFISPHIRSLETKGVCRVENV
jgi:hypothetical protein